MSAFDIFNSAWDNAGDAGMKKDAVGNVMNDAAIICNVPESALADKIIVVVTANMLTDASGEFQAKIELSNESQLAYPLPAVKIRTPYPNKRVRQLSAVRGARAVNCGIPLVFGERETLRAGAELTITWSVCTPGYPTLSVRHELTFSQPANPAQRFYSLNTYTPLTKYRGLDGLLRADTRGETTETAFGFTWIPDKANASEGFNPGNFFEYARRFYNEVRYIDAEDTWQSSVAVALTACDYPTGFAASDFHVRRAH